MKCLKLIAVCGLSVGLFFLPTKAHAGVPDVSNIMVTDVTTRSFSVIWTSSEASNPDLLVYSDADGVSSVGATLPNPVKCDIALASEAENLGAMKVQVTGLQANTTYYFQTTTTSISTSDLTEFPFNPEPLMQVTTAVRTVRADASNVPFSNDIMLSDWTMADGVTPADGTLVFASVTGGDYPVTTYVGDCVSSGNALIDLNNIFDKATGENFDLTQGVNLNLVNFRGFDGVSQIVNEVPVDNSLAELKEPAFFLKSGWNMFASQVMPDPSASSAVFFPLKKTGAILSAWDFKEGGGGFDTYLPNARVNSLSDVYQNVGYWVEIAAAFPSSLPLNGELSQSTTLLSAGWNMVGNRSLEWMPVSDFVANVSGPGGVVSIWSWNNDAGNFVTYRPGARLNTLNIIEPGKSYWIEMEASCVTQLCNI